MPQFKVQAPDGKVITVEGPDGSTQEQAIAYAQQQYKPEGPSTAGELGKAAGRGLTGFIGDIGEQLTGKNLREHISDLGASFRGGPSTFTPPYSAQMNKAAGLEPSPDASLGQKVASGAVEGLANPMSWVGPGGPLVKAGGAALSGAASELAGAGAKEFLPEGAEGPARLIGGALGGGAVGKTSGGVKNAAGARELKGGSEIKQASKDAFTILEQSPEAITPKGMDNLHTTVLRALGQANKHKLTADRTYGVVDELIGNKVNNPGRISDLLAVHEILGDIKPGPGQQGADAAAAQVAREAIRDWLTKHAPAANKPLKDALGNWSAQAKIDEITGGLDKAGRRAESRGSGAGFTNTMRQEVNKILDSPQRSRGYKPEELAQMKKIVSGTIEANLSRGVGKLAPTGPITVLAQAAMGWPLIGSGVAFGAKYLGEVLTKREIEKLITMIQERAPVNAAQATANQATRAQSSAVSKASALRGAYDSLNQAQPQ